jgi:hypothetical protein
LILCRASSIAAFSHAQWEEFSSLLDRALEMDASQLESWLDGFDANDAHDLRRMLKQRQSLREDRTAAWSSSPCFRDTRPRPR